MVDPGLAAMVAAHKTSGLDYTTAGHYLATTAGIDVRHNRKAAVAFMDGHAEMVDRPTLIANKDDIFGHIRWSN